MSRNLSSLTLRMQRLAAGEHYLLRSLDQWAIAALYRCMKKAYEAGRDSMKRELEKAKEYKS